MRTERPATQKRTLGILWFCFVVLILGVGMGAYFFTNSDIPQKLTNFLEESSKKAANSDDYFVISAVDGDTLEVKRNGTIEKVRLIGVDTPEKNHPSRPVECFAQAASTFTEGLSEQTYVRLVVDEYGQNRDRYDRLLRYVYLQDGTLLNAEIIKQGYGFAYLSFPFEKSKEFKVFEDTARQEGRGLWSGCNIEQDGVILKTDYKD